MTTYTLQLHHPSGCTHALRSDGDTITGISDYLTHDDIGLIRLDPSWLASIDYEPDPEYAADPWSAPTLTYPTA